MPKVAPTGFRQLPLGQMAHGLARPVARLKLEPDELTRHFGVEFEEARDDLNDLRAALVCDIGGNQFALVRHRGQPQGGTDIVASEHSSNPTEDLRRALRTLRCKDSDLDWIHPDVDRSALKVP